MADALFIGSSRGAWRSVVARALLSPYLACALAVVLLIAARLASLPDALVQSLGDTDDATRLYQLRELLAHGRWWDMTLPRIGAPEQLVTHWSRLVDGGLAIVLALSHALAGTAHPELVMRILWPSLLLLALLAIVARESARDGAPFAGHVAAGLAIMSASALYQFQPGRIDHHNVQILCSIGGILLLARSLAVPRTGWIAGALVGLGLVVGLEAATLVAPALVVAVLIGLGRPDGLGGVTRAAIALAVTLGVGVLATTAPTRLGAIVCDAASLNLVVLMAFGAAGVAAASAVATRLAGRRLFLVQLAMLAGFGTAGLAAYGVMEPACLAGPFGQVTRDAWPVWLEHVTEVQPISYLLARAPADTAAFILLGLAGIAAQTRCLLATREQDAGAVARELFLLAAQTLALVASCWQVKMMPYAAWLAIPALARTIAALPAIGSIGAPTVRIGAFVLVGQSTLAALVGATLPLLASQKAAVEIEPLQRTSCSDTTTVSALAALPAGLVLADINLGPYIVALTPHRVVMAPYHRIDRSIVLGHRLLESPPPAAERGLRELGIDYVAACRSTSVAAPASLQDALAAGSPPSYLTRVDVPSAPSLMVYRLAAVR